MKTRGTKKNSTTILSEICSGKYREHYLIYNRKSTDDTDNQKNSIKYQTTENGRFAARHGLEIANLSLDGFATAGVISERHSGFKENVELTFGQDNTVQYRVDRPKFHRLVQLLSGGYFKGVIFLCWDRASRNKGDDTILRKLMKAGVDIRFTLAQYEKTSAGALHMDIDGMFAEHHSRVTSEKVTLAKRDLRERGVCTYKAPVGYLNLGQMDHKPFDPLRAPIIRELYEMAASGEWSLADLARWAMDQGFTMPPVRRRRTAEEVLAEEDDDMRLEIEPISRPPTYNSIHKLLTNPFYTGKIIGNDGIWIKSASHEPMVSDELFARVQTALGNRNKSVHYSEPLDHPYRRLVRCGVCTRVYTPYTQKGITYYGARCDASCPNRPKTFNYDFLSAKIGALIARLSFTDEELAEIDARASTDIALLDVNRVSRLEQAERRKKRIREDLAYLNANRLTLLKTGAYTPEKLAADEAKLIDELDGLKEEEDTSDVSMVETVRDVVRLSELLKDVGICYKNADPQQKDAITRTIFSELSITENTLNYKCRKGFEPLAARFIPSHDPSAWLSELRVQREDIAELERELKTLIVGRV